MSLKEGKKPIKEKKNYVDAAEAFGGNAMELPKELAEYLDQEDLAHKWVAIRHFETKGRHPSGWQLFEVPEELKHCVLINKFNKVGTEYLETGDLILGVKPRKGPGMTQENHKKLLRQKVEAKTLEAQGVDEFGKPMVRKRDNNY